MIKKHLAFGAVLVFTVICLWPLSVASQTETDIDVRYESQEMFSNEELAQMLAPIALYPDALLSQILIASSYPFEVIEAERWLSKNSHLTPEALDAALDDQDWDLSIIALCQYPKILAMMVDHISWTAKLGDAFVSQEQEVMAIIQDLRVRASDAGHLATTPEQRVIVEHRIIRIEPVSEEYIYVPVYDPYVIYGSWWLPLPPFAFIYPGMVVTGPRIVYSPRIIIRVGAIGWSHFDWRARRTVIVPVDRTRKHPRSVYVKKDAPRAYWSPDRDRRYLRERRPPLKSSYDIQTQTQPPRKGGEVLKPSRSALSPQRTRVNERAPGPSTPRIGTPEKRPAPLPPGMTDKDKRSERPRAVNPEKRPATPQPKISDPNPRADRKPAPVAPRLNEVLPPKTPEQPVIKKDSRSGPQTFEGPDPSGRGGISLESGNGRTPVKRPGDSLQNPEERSGRPGGRQLNP